MSQIQAVLIDKKYNKKQQKEILSEMKVKPIKNVHETARFH